MSSSLIFVKCLLEAQSSIELICKHRDSLSHQQRKRHSPARERLIDALWNGIWQLTRETEECAKEALLRGQLLFCWAGTTALARSSEGGLS